MESSASGGTFYIFDNGALLGEVSSSGTVEAAYTWGAAGLVSERLVPSSASLWYGFGPQDETRLLTNSSGAVVDAYVYSAYGQPIASSGTDANPFRYGGQVGYYTDSADTGGAVLCTHRWYDPNGGRWISRDLVGYNGGANLYGYCVNSPANLADASGLDPIRLFPGGVPGLGTGWPPTGGGGQIGSSPHLPQPGAPPASGPIGAPAQQGLGSGLPGAGGQFGYNFGGNPFGGNVTDTTPIGWNPPGYGNPKQPNGKISCTVTYRNDGNTVSAMGNDPFGNPYGYGITTNLGIGNGNSVILSITGGPDGLTGVGGGIDLGGINITGTVSIGGANAGKPVIGVTGSKSFSQVATGA